MRVRIYQMSKSATQSGRGRTGGVVLERDDCGARSTEPLMGWVSAPDTRAQIRLRFQTIEAAVQYATDNGFDYVVDPVNPRRVRPRNYTDNFKYIPPAETGK